MGFLVQWYAPPWILYSLISLKGGFQFRNTPTKFFAIEIEYSQMLGVFRARDVMIFSRFLMIWPTFELSLHVWHFPVKFGPLIISFFIPIFPIHVTSSKQQKSGTRNTFNPVTDTSFHIKMYWTRYKIINFLLTHKMYNEIMI